MEQLNMAEIKQYNSRLAELKAKENRLKIERDMTLKSLDSACKELSEELGREVTADNAEQIYNEMATKLNETLRNGNEIISRIASEEAEASQGANLAMQSSMSAQSEFTQQVMPQAVAAAIPQAQEQINFGQAQAVAQTVAPVYEQAPVAPVMPVAPIQMGAVQPQQVIPPMQAQQVQAVPMMDMPQLFNN